MTAISTVAPRRFACLLAVTVATNAAIADEGLWLINQPPLKILKDRHGFEPKPGWLEHLQQSAVRIGASGSFVSPEGLVLTNHHVVWGSVERLSSSARNLVRDGFYARTRDAELRCPSVEAQYLVSIEDVTARVNAAIPAECSPADASAARKAEMTRIEAESRDKTGLDSEVVTLFHGARYHLYRYKRFDDVRLVFAPEVGIASFGGDVDNFEYPRFALDAAFVRVYENGQPARIEHYLKWSQSGVKDGDLVFALGHPGSTNRLLTVDHLAYLRDVVLPAQLAYIHWRETRINVFRGRSEENERIGQGMFFGVQNWRKAATGGYEALLGPNILVGKRAAERQLRDWIAADAGRLSKWASAWDAITETRADAAEVYLREKLLEDWYRWGAALLDHAVTIVRLADELPKPSAARLREFRDSELESLYLDLYSEAPIYDAREVEMMTSWLLYVGQVYGGEHPLVQQLLGGLSARERAESLVAGTTLKPIEQRRKLAAGGRAALDAVNDPMIAFARLLDPEARRMRAIVEDQIDSAEQIAYARISAARFAMLGDEAYPDATGTLRLSFGTVKGYREAGREVPAFTSFTGLYERAEERRRQPPFDLPPRWVERRTTLNLGTPFDFVSTTDIVGGNSGSPLVNRDGELVGLIFDGNLQSLGWNYAFDDGQGRSVAVDARAILEALRTVYEAEPLTTELLAPR